MKWTPFPLGTRWSYFELCCVLLDQSKPYSDVIGAKRRTTVTIQQKLRGVLSAATAANSSADFFALTLTRSRASRGGLEISISL